MLDNRLVVSEYKECQGFFLKNPVLLTESTSRSWTYRRSLHVDPEYASKAGTMLADFPRTG